MARVLSLAAEEVTARGQITRQQYELWYENGEDHFELQDVHRQRRDGARDGQPSCSEYGARRLLELVMPPEAAAA